MATSDTAFANKQEPLGIHLIADLYDCEHRELLDDANALQEICRKASAW